MNEVQYLQLSTFYMTLPWSALDYFEAGAGTVLGEATGAAYRCVIRGQLLCRADIAASAT